ITLESLPIKLHELIPLAIYLAMGWSCMLALDSIIAGMSPLAFNWLVAGGVLYTVGVVFFVLDNWFPWCHEIWHLFVLAGSACHYVTMYFL
ncbi:MAG: hemolysin III family protein, partial [Pseudomonadota bacterium]